jgi:hypothetical protein
MSFIYPRTIKITRPATDPEPTLTPTYRSLDPGAETPIASDIPASIQASRQGGANKSGLPSSVNSTLWRIFFRGEPGLLQDRDIITDDLGNRYKVIGAYWNSLGYSPMCEQLDV